MSAFSVFDLRIVVDQCESLPAPMRPAEVKVFEPVPVVTESRDLVQLYDDLLSDADQEKRVSVRTIRDNRSTLRKFQTWSETSGRLVSRDPVSLLQQPKILRDYAAHLRNQSRGHSAAMASKALGTIGKLANECVRRGVIAQRADRVSKSVVNMLRPRTAEQRRIKGVPVTLDEVRALLAVVDGCTWPRLGTVPPAVFWELCLVSHFVYGFRSQDWFAARNSEKQGLLWSGVIADTECPWIEGLHNHAGWVWYTVEKTKRKDESADRSPDVLVPLSSRLRGLIEQFRGLHPDRVFPLPNNSRRYSEEFARILQRAGLSDAERISVGKPIIRPSLGQRLVASLRKGCAAYWADAVSKAASSYLLHHAVQEEGVSRTTAEFYLQTETVLRAITSKIEGVPL